MFKFNLLLSLCVTLLFGNSIAVAQVNASGQLLAADSSKVHKVMIIPFDQNNYFSDADPELAEKNEQQVTDISRLFRYGLNYNISARVISSNPAHNILTDTTVASAEDLRMIYASVKYQFEKPMDVTKADTVAKQIVTPDLFGNGGTPEPEEKREKVFKKKDEAEEVKNEKYLNAVVTHPEIFPNLQKKYGTDLFLFINQFELVTNYNNCLDRSANFFERKVVVHYSIYDVTGKQLQGGAHTVTFSSGQTNVDEIIATQFPIIAEYLSNTINLLTAVPEKSKSK
jgi:hypothetical protein